jgi:hypothetical protein
MVKSNAGQNVHRANVSIFSIVNLSAQLTCHNVVSGERPQLVAS